MKNYAALVVAVAALVGSLVFTAHAQFSNPGSEGGGGGGVPATGPADVNVGVLHGTDADATGDDGILSTVDGTLGLQCEGVNEVLVTTNSVTYPAGSVTTWTGRAKESSPADNQKLYTSNDGSTGYVTSSVTADTMTVYAADGSGEGGLTVTGTTILKNGAARTAPTLYFAGDPDTGWGHEAAGNGINLTLGGVHKITYTVGVVQFVDPIRTNTIKGNSAAQEVRINGACDGDLATDDGDLCIDDALEVDGDAHFDGGTTHVGDHSFRGEMYRADDPNATAIASATVWYEVGNFLAGVQDGFTSDSTGLTVTNAGDYLVLASFNASGSANDNVVFGVSVNDTVSSKCHVHRTIGTGSANGVGSISCILTLAASDVLKFEVKNDDTTNNVTLSDVNLSAVQL